MTGPAGGRVGPDFADVGIDFEDVFGDLFGASGGFGAGSGVRSPARTSKPSSQLTVEEAYQGGRRRITLPGTAGTRSYEVNIPAGVVDGQRIRLAGEGGKGSGDSPAGDLYLVVRIAPHPRYRVSGRDVYLDLPVTPWEAALGATVAVTAPGGEAKVKVPTGSSSGRRLRLRGEGLPNPRGDAGDLYAEVRIMVPPHLTRRERKLFEELAAESTFDPRRHHDRSAALQCSPAPQPVALPADLETLARRSSVHPDLIRRFVALGLLDASQDASGRWCFAAGTAARVARIQRLHAGFA